MLFGGCAVGRAGRREVAAGAAAGAVDAGVGAGNRNITFNQKEEAEGVRIVPLWKWVLE